MNSELEKEISGHGIFVGRFVHSLDPKKRLTIPSEWRAQVGTPKGVYVLPDIHERCLCVYPAKAMVEKLQRMSQHSMADEKARDFARVLASQSDLVSWDVQGRIRIKDELLDHATLVDQVALVGALDRFELWNPELLRDTEALKKGNLQEAAKYVGF